MPGQRSLGAHHLIAYARVIAKLRRRAGHKLLELAVCLLSVLKLLAFARQLNDRHVAVNQSVETWKGRPFMEFTELGRRAELSLRVLYSSLGGAYSPQPHVKLRKLALVQRNIRIVRRQSEECDAARE